MKRRTLASIAGLLGLALAMVWFLSRGERHANPPVDLRVVVVAPAPEVAIAPPEDASVRAALEVATVVQRPEVAARTDIEPEPADEDPLGGQWIEGRVEFPPGTPSDERARIAAREPPINHNFHEKDLGDFAIDADGRFRVPVPEKAWTVVLEVEGRYLYSARAQRIDIVESAPDDVVLRPELGACARLRLVPSPLALARGIVFTRSTASVHATRAAPEDFFTTNRTEIDEHGFVELRALRPGSAKTFRAIVAGTMWTEVEVPALRAGELRELELTLAAAPLFTGIVRDEQGAPIADARLRLDTTSAGGDCTTFAASGADGRYVLYGCSEGSARLHVERVGFLTAELGPWSVGAESDFADLEVVLGGGAAIAGRVRWPDGSAAAGVDVIASSAGDATAARTDADPFVGAGLRARTGPDGKFRITGLVAGAYTVTARASERLVRGDRKSPRVLWVARAREVIPPTPDLALVLSKGTVVRGRVVDELGAPVLDAQVVANPNSPWSGESGHTVSVDADGRFELDAVRAGEWRIVARRPTAILSDPVIVVVSENAPTEVEIVVEAAAAIAGRVLDPFGAPVGGAEVRVEAGDESTARRTWLPSGSTLVDGTFRIEGLPPGRLRLTARKDAFSRSLEVVVSTTDDPAASGVELVLRTGGTIAGIVLAADGVPIPGEQVELHRDGFARAESSATSGAHGRFRFEHVEPGTLQVFVPWSRGSSSITCDLVVVEDGATTRVELRAR